MIPTTDSSLKVLIREAERRGIESQSFPTITNKIIMLVLDQHRESLFMSRPDLQGSVTKIIFDNKMLTTAILRRAGFPVPNDIITNDVSLAGAFLTEHQRLVVKPISNTGGLGITTDVTTISQLEPAFELARQHSNDTDITEDQDKVLCQQFVAGEDYRILVVDQQHVFAIHRLPAHVIGDGVKTVAALVQEWNVTRKAGCYIRHDSIADKLLTQVNLHWQSVPQDQQHVRLAGVANYHSGGRLHDATDTIGPAARKMAIEVARYFRTPIVGIDFLATSIATDPGYIIELNGTPDITIHHTPDQGTPRNVAGVMIDMLFPETVS